MRILYITVLVTAFGGVFLLFLYGGSGSHAPRDKRISIVCTTSIIADTVRHIVGDRAQVISLMGPGVDPHVYRARESDVQKLAQADLIFYNGLHLEGKLADILASLAAHKPTIAIAHVIDAHILLKVAEDVYDPHIWHDVQLWIRVAHYIGDVLAQYDCANAAYYYTNTAAYVQELNALDIYSKQQVQTIAREQRIMITAHDAFSYFGRAYAFEVIGLQGISTEAEVGIKDVQDLARYIADRHIPVIFVETSIAPRSMHAVQQAVAACGWQVTVGPELFSDALGDPTTHAGTYCGMIKHNIDTLVCALQN